MHWPRNSYTHKRRPLPIGSLSQIWKRKKRWIENLYFFVLSVSTFSFRIPSSYFHQHLTHPFSSPRPQQSTHLLPLFNIASFHIRTPHNKHPFTSLLPTWSYCSRMNHPLYYLNQGHFASPSYHTTTTT